MIRTNLKKIREAQGLSQRELAELCGKNQSVVSRIESGEVGAPRMDTVLMFAKALGVEAQDLVAEPTPASDTAAEVPCG